MNFVSPQTLLKAIIPEHLVISIKLFVKSTKVMLTSRLTIVTSSHQAGCCKHQKETLLTYLFLSLGCLSCILVFLSLNMNKTSVNRVTDKSAG